MLPFLAKNPNVILSPYRCAHPVFSLNSAQMPRNTFLVLFTLLVSPVQGEITGFPLKNAIKSKKNSFYEVKPAESGVDFTNPLITDHPKRYLYHSGFVCGGVGIGDLNLDGAPDLVFTSGTGENAVFLQSPETPWKFVLQPECGIGGGEAWGTGVTLVDIDADGDLDVYVSNYDSPNQLFENQWLPEGKLLFRERAGEYGLDVHSAGLTSAFADFDRDGDLDVYLLNNRFYRPGGRPVQPPFRKVNGKPEVLPEYQRYYQLREDGANNYKMDAYGQPDLFFRNDGPRDNGRPRFSEHTAAAGIAGTGHGLSVTWWDYDKDGCPDIYVGNDFTDPDRLYHNNGDGTFTEKLASVLPHCTWSSMGADSGDLNNDGWPDFISADMAATTHFKAKVNMGDMSRHRKLMETGWPRQTMRNMAYINSQSGMFLETAYLSGLAASDWTWAVKIADFDCDGWNDVFMANGSSRNFTDADIPFGPSQMVGTTVWDYYRDTPEVREKNLVFLNNGDLTFSESGADWGFHTETMSYSAATGDIDNDGDEDLVVVNLNEPVSLFRNDSSGNSRLVIDLRMPGRNPSAIGATVTGETPKGRKVYRYHNPWTGFASTNDFGLVIGLGAERTLSRLTIDWPDGTRQVHGNLAAGRRYRIEQNKSTEPATRPPAPERLLVYRSKLLPAVGHRETAFDDYLSQPLLPGKLSQLGPGLAVADINGDGIDDLYVGGASRQAGTVLVSGKGRHARLDGPWKQDALCEDMGALWFDADGDGDRDLLVGSGTNEFKEGVPPQQNRLYLQTAPLVFEKAGGAVLPDRGDFSSALAVADFDRDGDLDVFCGTRCLPGRYPKAASSRLWENVTADGRCRFVESKAAPALHEIGLVTSGFFVDMNADTWPDLVLAREWGSPVYLENRKGTFVDRTETSGLSELTGWWNGVAPGDFNGDGALDLLLGNAGWNTKYGRPTEKKPTLLYYGDMDDTGKLRLVEAKAGAEGILPVRGRSCSSRAMPFVADKFASFRAFAAANLSEIYTDRRLENAEKFAATELRSGILLTTLTDGAVRFRWSPLPVLAQASPVYGCAVVDIDDDGLSDVVMTQNHHSREPETGLWRGSPGMVLRNKSEGRFEVMLPGESGFSVPGDGKALVLGSFAKGKTHIAVSQNNGSLLVYELPKVNPGKPKRGMTSGGGYLSQHGR